MQILLLSTHLRSVLLSTCSKLANRTSTDPDEKLIYEGEGTLLQFPRLQHQTLDR